MNKINLFPKFAKFSLVLTFSVFSASLAYLFVEELFGLPRNGVGSAAVVALLVLFLPVSLSGKYMTNVIAREERNLNFTQDDYLQKLVDPLLDGLGYNVRVGYYESEDVNAFAISSVFGKTASIAFTTKLLSVVNDEQLFAFAAHEVAHIKNGDSKNKAYILVFNHAVRTYERTFKDVCIGALKIGGLLFGGVAVAGFAVGAAYGDVTDAFKHTWMFLGPFVAGAAAVGACILAFIGLVRLLDRAFFAYSREREFAADATGAEMTSAPAMISALELLSDSRDSVGVIDTHPPLEERKRRLALLAAIRE